MSSITSVSMLDPASTGIATVTIANGASLSDVAFLGRTRLVGIVMPASWTAADLTFQVSADNATYNEMYDEFDAAVMVQAAAARYIAVTPSLFAGAMFLKIRSGTSAAAVNQGAERVITLVCQEF